MKTEKNRNQVLGKRGESIVLAVGLKKGLALLDRNVRTPYGEIDIIFNADHMLIFAEVKTRSSLSFGFPEQAITPAKLFHMISSARFYIEEHQVKTPWRLDVIAVLMDPNSETATEVKWIENVC